MIIIIIIDRKRKKKVEDSSEKSNSSSSTDCKTSDSSSSLSPNLMDVDGRVFNVGTLPMRNPQYTATVKSKQIFL